MKNKIISLAIAVFLIGSPIAFANAQTTTGTKTTISTAELQSLLSLLVSELAALEQEYNQLEAAQANTAQELSQIASSTVATTTVATTSQTLSQLEAVVPQVVQTSTVTHQQSVAVSNSSQNTQQVASAAPTLTTSTTYTYPSIDGGFLSNQINNLIHSCQSIIGTDIEDNGPEVGQRMALISLMYSAPQKVTIENTSTGDLITYNTIPPLYNYGSNVTSVNLYDANGIITSGSQSGNLVNGSGTIVMTLTPSLQTIETNYVVPALETMMASSTLGQDGLYWWNPYPASYQGNIGQWEFSPQLISEVQSTVYPIVCGNISIQ